MCVRARVCVCVHILNRDVCVHRTRNWCWLKDSDKREREGGKERVQEREKEREREREKERTRASEREREREKLCVYTSVRESVYMCMKPTPKCVCKKVCICVHPKT